MAKISFSSPGPQGASGPEGFAPDATDLVKGHIKLTGDLGGTAEIPTVPALTTKQPLDTDLTAIAALSPTNDDIIQRKSNVWTNRTMAQLAADLTPYVFGAADIPSASSTVQGKVKLNGDLGGTADAPTVPGLATKQPMDNDLTAIANLAPVQNDIIQRKAGAWVKRSPSQFKSDLVLSKTDVGLSNVDNTSDANKPISSATQAALNAKAGATISVVRTTGKSVAISESMQSDGVLVLTLPTTGTYRLELQIGYNADGGGNAGLDVYLVTTGGLIGTVSTFAYSDNIGGQTRHRTDSGTNRIVGNFTAGSSSAAAIFGSAVVNSAPANISVGYSMSDTSESTTTVLAGSHFIAQRIL